MVLIHKWAIPQNTKIGYKSQSQGIFLHTEYGSKSPWKDFSRYLTTRVPKVSSLWSRLVSPTEFSPPLLNYCWCRSISVLFGHIDADATEVSLRCWCCTVTVSYPWANKVKKHISVSFSYHWISCYNFCPVPISEISRSMYWIRTIG